MNYDALFANPTGRTSRREYAGALIVLLSAFVFYYVYYSLLRGLSGPFGMLVLLYPAVVLHARRLRDMGRTAWLLAAPVALIVAAFWLHTASPGSGAQLAAGLAALAVSAGIVLWSLTGAGRADAA